MQLTYVISEEKASYVQNLFTLTVTSEKINGKSASMSMGIAIIYFHYKEAY